VTITDSGEERRARQSIAAGFSRQLTKSIDSKTIESLLPSLAADIRGQRGTAPDAINTHRRVNEIGYKVQIPEEIAWA